MRMASGPGYDTGPACRSAPVLSMADRLIACQAGTRRSRLTSRPSMKTRPMKITTIPTKCTGSSRSCSTTAPSTIAEIGVMKVLSERFVAPTRAKSQ